VVVTTSAGDLTSCRVLYRMKATEMDVGNASKKSVTVVQATTHKKATDGQYAVGVVERSPFGRQKRYEQT